MPTIPIIARLKLDPEDFLVMADFNVGVDPQGYAWISLEGRKVHVHRMIAEAMTSPEAIQGKVVDHINKDRLDARRCNLRVVTQSENMSNMGIGHIDGSSQFVGVSWTVQSNRWHCNIKRKDLTMYIGRSPNERACAKMYDAAAILLDGLYAATNILEPTENFDPTPYLKQRVIDKITDHLSRIS